jgi:dihydroflavonol-4-reductase
VVTGATGHVGANLVRALLAEQPDRRIRVTVRKDTRALEGLPGIERVRADVDDLGSLERAFAGADLVYHLAGRISIVGSEGGLVERTNVLGARHAVEACLRAGVRRLVHFSSIHAFEQEPLLAALDESRGPAEAGAPAYDRSKAAGEREILAGVARGLDAVIVNPTAILGPHDYRLSRVGEVIVSLTRRTLPSLVDGGFDWVDVRDVCAGAIAAAARGRRGERYLLGGCWRSVLELARTVAEVTGSPPPRLSSPLWLARIGAPFVEVWSKLRKTTPLYTRESLHALRSNRRITHAKATRELGYAPRPLLETIRDTVAWHRAAGNLPSA